MSVKHMKLFMMNVILDREHKLSDVSCGVLFYCLNKFNQEILILLEFATNFFFSKFDSITKLLSTNSFKLNVIFNRENKHADV